MDKYYVDIRCLVEAEDIGKTYSKIQRELYEYIMNSDILIEHDVISIKQKRDDFYD